MCRTYYLMNIHHLPCLFQGSNLLPLLALQALSFLIASTCQLEAAASCTEECVLVYVQSGVLDCSATKLIWDGVHFLVPQITLLSKTEHSPCLFNIVKSDHVAIVHVL